MNVNGWLSDVFFNWPAAEDAWRAEEDLEAVADEFLAGSPWDGVVSGGALAADFLSRV